MSDPEALRIAALEARIDHLDRAQRLANTGSWEWNIATNGLTWSDQIFRIFGLEPGAIDPTYPAFLERVHPDDRALVETRVNRALERIEDYDLDHRIVLSDGEVRTVQETGVVEFGADGNPTRMLGAVRDVTDLRAAEASSRRSREMLASLFQISPEALVVADQNGCVLLFSAGAESMFGYSAGEVLGRSVEMLMPVDVRASHQGHVHGFAAGRERSRRMHQRGAIRGQRKNGETFPAEASLAKLETGDRFVFTTVIRDLSERHAAEQSLIEARELAERANVAKSSFLANMSHEIRTPLNGILGLVSVLADTDLSGRQAEMVDLIQVSSRALEGLLGDILDLAKVDAGRLQIRDEPFDLARLARDAAALFRASAAKKGVSLRVEIDPLAVGAFIGDDLRIRQVLSNLLSNAVKFTEAGEIVLSVAAPHEGDDSCRLRFAVQDSGIGFTTQAGESLFARFEQADGSITRRFGGTGLGLAISRALVELMSGTIEAVSVPGQGATFSFELPLKRAVTVADLKADARREPREAREIPVDGLKILLAEDHPINRRAVELILEALPVELTCVENGLEAVAAARSGAFDLILMDMQMPLMDGLTAIRHIRDEDQAAGRASPRICVLTANALQEHRDAAEAAGARDFLTKPIGAEALITYVLDACQPDEASAPAGALVLQG